MNKTSKILDKAVIVIVCIILSLYSISIFLPLIWGLITSLKSNTDFLFLGNVLGLPNLKHSRSELLQLSNYKIILDAFNFKRSISFYSNGVLKEHFSDNNVLRLLLNTLIYAGVGSFLQAFMPAIVAYACAKYDFKLSKIIFVFTLAVMVMPIIGSYPSEIALLRALNIYDTFIGYFLQKMGFMGIYFFVFHAFFKGFPNAYIEAAEVDGASQLRILLLIVVPLSATLLASVMLIQFVHFWNDYQTALLYMPTKPTLAYGVYYMTNVGANVVINGIPVNLARTPIRVAGCMILAIPILILFIFMKDKLMGNLSMGGIKG